MSASTLRVALHRAINDRAERGSSGRRVGETVRVVVHEPVDCLLDRLGNCRARARRPAGGRGERAAAHAELLVAPRLTGPVEPDDQRLEVRALLTDGGAIGFARRHGADPPVVLVDRRRDVALPPVAGHEDVGDGLIANGGGRQFAHPARGVVWPLGAALVAGDQVIGQVRTGNMLDRHTLQKR
jgi:hypothetical protein